MVEVMIVVAILAVLLGIAAPAYTEMVASQRVRDTASDLHTSLMRARSEAISRSTPVTIKAVGGNLANGWHIADPSGTYNPDPANPTVFIEQHGPVKSSTIAGATDVTFTNVGRLSGGAIAIKISVTGTAVTRCVTADLAGRAKIRTIAASDACT